MDAGYFWLPSICFTFVWWLCPYYLLGITFPLNIPGGNVPLDVLCSPTSEKEPDAPLLEFELWIRWPKRKERKKMVEAHASHCNFQKTVALFLPPLCTTLLEKCLGSWACFSKLLVNSRNSPMPFQQISFWLKAKRICFCCLQPKNTEWKCG